jgi:hypothetical protein
MRKPLLSFVFALIYLGLGQQTWAADAIATYREFNRLKNDGHRFPEPNPVPFAMSYNGGGQGHLLVGCLVQGRKVGCLHGVNKIFQEYLNGPSGEFKGRLTFFLANPATTSVGSVNSQNEINSSFGEEAEAGDEKARADELKVLLKGANFYLEVSQLVSASEEFAEGTKRPYFYFPFSTLNYFWAKALRVSDTLIDVPASSQRSALTMADFARKQRVPSLSLDLNQKDATDEAAEAALNSFRSAVSNAMQVISGVGVENTNAPAKIFQHIEKLEMITGKKVEELKNFYFVAHSEPYSSKTLKLKEGLKNFQSVKKTEAIGVNSAGNEPIVPAVDGLLFNPKYLKVKDTAETPAEDASVAKEPKLPRYLYQILQETSFQTLEKDR